MGVKTILSELRNRGDSPVKFIVQENEDGTISYGLTDTYGTAAIGSIPNSALPTELAAIGALPDGLMSTAYQTSTTSAAITSSAAVSFTATHTAYRARIKSVDLALPVCTTDAAGYAAGAKVINTAADGSGSIYVGDKFSVAGSSEVYESLTGDANLASSAALSLPGYGVAVTIPAAATAMTLVSRGEKFYGAINCDNSVEALIACTDPLQRDFELTLGEELLITATAPISNIWIVASSGVVVNAHRLTVEFGD